MQITSCNQGKSFTKMQSREGRNGVEVARSLHEERKSPLRFYSPRAATGRLQFPFLRLCALDFRGFPPPDNKLRIYSEGDCPLSHSFVRRKSRFPDPDQFVPSFKTFIIIGGRQAAGRRLPNPPLASSGTNLGEWLRWPHHPYSPSL